MAVIPTLFVAFAFSRFSFHSSRQNERERETKIFLPRENVRGLGDEATWESSVGAAAGGVHFPNFRGPIICIFSRARWLAGDMCSSPSAGPELFPRMDGLMSAEISCYVSSQILPNPVLI